MALAAAIAQEDALPEALNGQDPAALARHLEAAAVDPGFPIVSALAAREQAARRSGDLLSFEGVEAVLDGCAVDLLDEAACSRATLRRRIPRGPPMRVSSCGVLRECAPRPPQT
jgi:hypothetical protein